MADRSGRHEGKEVAPTGEGKPRGRGSLVQAVADSLRETILQRDLAPGEKLPSEAGLTERFSVSRTVIREAIASLRADGLVEVRHGVGVFVLEPPSTAAAAFQPFEMEKISSIIEMLELRAAVEIEAAGLAAVRRSPAQDEAIWECYDDLEKLVAERRPTVEADRAFHLAIADASNNPRFREFLELLGRNVIPRSSLQRDDKERTPEDYLRQIQAEHRRIAEAVSTRDEAAARDAVRTHLKGSQQRYRDMIRRS